MEGILEWPRQGGVSGAAVGAVVGGMLLALLGPNGIAIGTSVGGLVGTVLGSIGGTIGGTAKALTVENGVTKERIKNLQSSLEPGSSGILPVFGEVTAKTSHWNRVYKKGVEEGVDGLASVVAGTINSALKDNMVIGFAVALTEEGGLMATRLSLSEEKVNFGTLRVNSDAEVLAVETGLSDKGQGALTAIVAGDDALFACVYVVDGETQTNVDIEAVLDLSKE